MNKIYLLCVIFNKTLIFSQVGKSLGGIGLKSPHSNPTFVLSPVTSLLVGICFRAWGRENGTLAHKCAVVFWGQSREALPKPQGLLGWRGNITSLFTKGFLHWASWGYGWKTGWDQLNMTDWIKNKEYVKEVMSSFLLTLFLEVNIWHIATSLKVPIKTHMGEKIWKFHLNLIGG